MLRGRKIRDFASFAKFAKFAFFREKGLTNDDDDDDTLLMSLDNDCAIRENRTEILSAG